MAMKALNIPLVLAASQGMAVASEAFDLQNHWFDSPVKSASALTSKMTFSSAQCAQQTLGKRSITSQDFVQNQLSLQSYSISQSLFRDYTQFWQLGEDYYQLSAVWDYDVPASYRIEFYRSSDPKFNRDVIQLSVADTPIESVDALSVESIFEQTISSYKAQGARMGSNIKVNIVQDVNNTPYEVTFLNQSPVVVAANQFNCRINASLNALQCVCDNAVHDTH